MKKFAAKKKWGAVIFSFLFLFGNGNFVYAAGLYEFGIPIESYGTGSYPTSVISADFDNDGDQDLTVTNNGSSNVSILKNNGDGTFATKVDYGTGSYPISVASADFDDDGDQDLAVANYGSSNVSILKNNGDGTFSTKVDYGTGSYPYSVTSVDFDGDGDLDLAVANNGSSNVSILKNNGDGTFSEKVDYGTGNYPSSVTSADFDGDGDQDLAVANTGWDSGTGSVSVLKNNGDGTFATKVDYGTGGYSYSVTSADFDGDGYSDLAVANTGFDYDWDFGIGSVSVLKNNGDGTFSDKVDYRTGSYNTFPVTSAGSYPVSVTSADFDGDGDQDIVMANEDSMDVSILKNNGDGTFSDKMDYGTGSYPSSVTSADFDGDGDQDLAVANYSFNAVSILKNNGDGTFSTKVDYGTGSFPCSVISADFDSDGDQDLAVVNCISNTVSILKNNGDGTFATKVDYGTEYGSFLSVTAADLDGDGDLDLAVANGESSNVSILKNNGDGTFSEKVDYVMESYSSSVISADFDGDGDQDLAVANYSFNAVSILKNNGDGTFSDKMDYGTGSYPYSITSADFDGDGYLDLAVANQGWDFGTGSVSVLKNNGDGTFSEKVDYGRTGGYSYSVTSADFDGDGDQDLAVANSWYSNTVSILKNNGDGTFATNVDYETGSIPYSVTSSDFDGDGYQDLAVANESSSNVSILKNNGDGTFSDKMDYGTGSYPYSITSADFDGDGDQDFATANVGSNEVSVFLNNNNSTSLNRAPVASSINVTTEKNVSLPITLSATDSDVPAQTITYSIVSGPAHGTLGTISDNQVTYTSSTDYVGNDSFTFKVNDGKTDSNVGTVDIKIQQQVNISPTLTPLSDDDYKDGINPNKGVANKDLLTFKTIYTDKENATATKMDVVIRNTVDFNSDFYKEQLSFDDSANIVVGSDIDSLLATFATTTFIGSGGVFKSDRDIAEGESVTATLKRENIYQASTTVMTLFSLPILIVGHADVLLEALDDDNVVAGSSTVRVSVDLDNKIKSGIVSVVSTRPIKSLRLTAKETWGADLWIEKYELGEKLPMIPDTSVSSDGDFKNGEQYTASSVFPKGKYTFNFETADSALSTSTASHDFTTGYSNVAFLPGLEASRLYWKDPNCWFLNCENQLWLANSNADVENLYLSATSGESILPNVYTRDVINSAGGVGTNIYAGFLLHMKAMVTKGDINRFEPLPYDWRLDVRDVVNRPILLENYGSYSMIDSITSLASTSDSGKVTIIGHSNGGLVGKVLINELKKQNKENLVEQFIMVASPELGTPAAIIDMLHGTNLVFDYFPSKEVIRELGENMKSAYALLPSREYFNRLRDPLDVRPLVEFSTTTAVTQIFRNKYGDNISDYDTLRRFLTGENGLRREPLPSIVNEPNVLKGNFLSDAEALHSELDGWKTPDGVKTIEVAGWGLTTARGVVYKSATSTNCDWLTNSCTEEEVIDPQPLTTTEGDGTVVYPSAKAIGSEVYWVNIFDFNKTVTLAYFRGRDHKSILEVPSLQSLLSTLITGQSNSTLPLYITNSKPEVTNADDRLAIGVHSPVSLNIYDSFGRHTGPISDPNSQSLYEEQIPNSYYWQIGEGQYAGADNSTTTTIELHGTGAGTFTMDIQNIVGGVTATTTVFEDVPVTASSTATMQVKDKILSPIALDINGDGTVDANISVGGLTDENLIGILKGMIKAQQLPVKKETALLKKVEKLEKTLAKEFKNEQKEKRKTGEAFKTIIQKIKQFEKKRLLTSDESKELLTVIEQIKTSVIK